MGNQYQSTRLELEENINLLRRQVFESAKRVGTMKDETSRLRTLNQASVNRCERILEEKTSLIRKYEQSSSHVHQKLEEAARVARKQMEDLQAVLVQAVANAQQEVEEMHKVSDTVDLEISCCLNCGLGHPRKFFDGIKSILRSQV